MYLYSTFVIIIIANFQPSSSSCRCYNPFQDLAQSFLGDPTQNCNAKGACFVPCDASCSDTVPSKSKYAGRGKCISSAACKLDGGFVPERPDVFVAGLEQNCEEGSECDQDNKVNFVETKNEDDGEDLSVSTKNGGVDQNCFNKSDCRQENTINHRHP